MRSSSSVNLVLGGLLGLALVACPSKDAAKKDSPGPATTASSSASTTIAMSSSSSGAAKAKGDLLVDYGASKRPEPPAGKKAEWLGIFTKGVAVPKLCDASGLDIQGFYDGAFTKKDAKETAVQIGRCGTSPVSQFSYLVIIADGALVASHKVADMSLDAVMDVDGDGISELLISGGGTGQGYTVSSARLVSMKDKKLTEVHPFGEVASDNCGTLDTAKSGKTVALYVVRGERPAYSTTSHTTPCAP